MVQPAGVAVAGATATQAEVEREVVGDIGSTGPGLDLHLSLLEVDNIVAPPRSQKHIVTPVHSHRHP